MNINSYIILIACRILKNEMSADLRITVDLRNWRKVYFYFCNNIREDYKFTLSN